MAKTSSLREPFSPTGNVKYKMSHQKVFVILVSPFVIIAAFVSIYNDYTFAKNFSANGIVTEARWNTSNHGLSLFMIRNGTGKPKKFQASDITLEPNQIKVGDTFFKISGSKICTIGGVEILCVK